MELEFGKSEYDEFGPDNDKAFKSCLATLLGNQSPDIITLYAWGLRNRSSDLIKMLEARAVKNAGDNDLNIKIELAGSKKKKKA